MQGGPQYNLLNTATLQTNSVDYLKKASLGSEREDLSLAPNLSKFLNNGSFYSDIWTKFK